MLWIYSCSKYSSAGVSVGSSTADFVSEVATIRYDSVLEEVIICERIEIIDDQLFEPLETFSVQLRLVTPNIDVIFMIDTATITIVDNDCKYRGINCTDYLCIMNLSVLLYKLTNLSLGRLSYR